MALTRPHHIAILGGGISGLSTAWYLSRIAPPHIKISLFESSSRTGGWMQSSRKSDPGHPGGSVLLEHGPRTLRAQGVNGLNTLELVKQLGLTSELATVTKESSAAKSRYILTNNKLSKMPNSFLGAISHPYVAPKIPGILLDLFKGSSGKLDESIHDFVSRRFGKSVSDDIVSAMMHGVYAGDVSQLSVRSTMGILYNLEKEYRSVGLGLLMGGDVTGTPFDEALKERIGKENPEFKAFVEKTSIFSFKDGIETLAKGLKNKLVQENRVNLQTGAKIEKLEFDSDSDGTVQIELANKETINVDSIISALPPLKLDQILGPKKTYPELSYNPSVTVAVVNLVFPTEQAKLDFQGFGYLIPKNETSIATIQHGGLLGVVFDSAAIPEQDLGPSQSKTLKLTAMIGGHLFDKVISGNKLLGSDSKTIETFFENVAIKAAKEHLKIEMEPSLVQVRIQKECIPQYLVGHISRLQALDSKLRSDYNGKLAVTGAGYLGVSVNDCIRNARELAEGVVARIQEDQSEESALVGKLDAVTGLERSWFM